MKIKIKKATIKDIDSIVLLWENFREEHTSIVIKNNKNLEPHTRLKKNSKKIWEEYIKKQIYDKKGFVQLAYVDDKLAGFNFSHITENIPIFSIEKFGTIGDLFIKKEFRGLKISSEFKNNAIKWFKSRKIKYISIQVWNNNEKAHNIYKKWGFYDINTQMRKKL